MSRLVLLLLLGSLFVTACGREEAAATRIVIDINHSKFEPAAIQVPENRVVTFVVRNHDPIDHEFIVGDEHVQLVHEKGTEGHHGAKPGEISIPAGETRTTTYTFGRSEGSLLFGCHLPGHYAYGMRGLVTITA